MLCKVDLWVTQLALSHQMIPMRLVCSFFISQLSSHHQPQLFLIMTSSIFLFIPCPPFSIAPFSPHYLTPFLQACHVKLHWLFPFLVSSIICERSVGRREQQVQAEQRWRKIRVGALSCWALMNQLSDTSPSPILLNEEEESQSNGSLFISLTLLPWVFVCEHVDTAVQDGDKVRRRWGIETVKVLIKVSDTLDCEMFILAWCVSLLSVREIMRRERKRRCCTDLSCSTEVLPQRSKKSRSA